MLAAGARVGRVRWDMIGDHNVDNALADSEKGRCKKTDKTENRE